MPDISEMKELEAHGEMMKEHRGMHHDAPHMVEVAPGKSGVIVWQFTTPGEFYYACLVEDHFELGMYGKIKVSGKPASGAASEHAHMHPQAESLGMYGGYPMARESSGTAWQPDASPHQGIHAMYGDWLTTTHGIANLIYDRQGGPRGDRKTLSTSMLMVMAQRAAGEGTLGLRGMPAFMFHEGHDPIAEQAFREIARLTRGAYCRFDLSAAHELAELLRAAAVYAAGGVKALADLSARRGAGARKLLAQMR